MFCEILECPRNIGREPKKWPPLLQTLGRLINHIEYTEEGILKMPLEEKCKHIKADLTTGFKNFSLKSCATQLILLEKLLISFTE